MGGFVVRFQEGTSRTADDVVNVSQMQQSDIVEHGNAVNGRESETDCERGRSATNVDKPPPGKAAINPRRKYKSMSATNKMIYRMLTLRLKSLPEPAETNALHVRDMITVYRTRTLAGQDTGLTTHETVDVVFNLIRLGNNHWAPNGPQLITALELGIIDAIPPTTTAEIEDKSNSDHLIKILAVGHAGWQMIQLIIRFAEGLPSSQLEVATVGFSLCAFCAYIFMWNKPQDVKTPCFISAARYPTQNELLALARRGPSNLAGLYTGHEYTIPEHALYRTGAVIGDGGPLAWMGSTLTGVLFGLLHCTAWEFHFPTLVERGIWRWASVLIIVVPLFFCGRVLWMMATQRIRWQEESGGWKRSVILIAHEIFASLIIVAFFLIFCMS